MTVLIVDDEMPIREGLKNSIDWKSHGVSYVDTACSGIQAFEMCSNLDFDLVITDIKMPHMTGLELADKLRTTHPDTRIIILTGFAEFEYAQKAVSLNVLEFLLKPVNIGELETLVEQIAHETGKKTISNVLVEKAKLYIRQNSSKPISVQDIANYVERNPNYLSNIFKKEENTSLIEYLNSVRIQNAQHLLSSTSLYTYEISEKVGYADYRYFTQVFKKFTSLSPSEYRRKNSKI